MPSNARELLGRSVLFLGVALSGCAFDFGPENDGDGGGGLGSTGDAPTSTGGAHGVGANGPGQYTDPQTVECAECLPLAEQCPLPNVTVETMQEVRRSIRSTRTYASAGYVNAAIRRQVLPDPSRVIIDDVVNDLARVVTDPTTVVRFTGEVDPSDQRPLVKLESYVFGDASVGAASDQSFAVVVDRTVRMAPVFALQEAIVSNVAERASSLIVSAVGGEPEAPEVYDPAKLKALFAAPQASGDVVAAATKALDALDKSSSPHLLLVVDGSASLGAVYELAAQSGVVLDVLVVGQIDDSGEAAFDAQALLGLPAEVTTIGIFANEGEDPGTLVEVELGGRFDEYFGVARREPNLTWLLPDYFEEVMSVGDAESATPPLSLGFDRTVKREGKFLIDPDFDVATLAQLCEGVHVVKTTFLDGPTEWATSVTSATGFLGMNAERPAIVVYFDAIELYARALRVPAQAPEACTATDMLAAKCAIGKLDATVCANVAKVRANLDFVARTANTGSCAP